MALISPESLDRLKQTADIVEVISAHTDLRRQGARWVGLCPFHEERTPSFSVDGQEKLYHCFGCGVGGDVIKFVEEKEGLGFSEAVELLADRYGVELEREQEDPRAEARRQQRRRLEQLLERAATFYSSFLWESKEAGKARDYLAERGLGEEVLRGFGVGYAPSAWDKILVLGQRAGFRIEELRGVGLVQRGRGGGEYDRFRSRIMFPIRDRRGRTLGFGGRAMRSDQGAKYVNTAETDFFHKSQAALRGRPGEGGDRQGDPRRRGRGLHRRPGAAPGRGGGDDRGDGHGDHRRAGGDAVGDGRGGGAGAGRRFGRPGGDAARAAGGGRPQDALDGGLDAGRGGPGRDARGGGWSCALPRAT